MLVETFEVEKTVEEESENIEAIRQLITDCGLKAQEQFVNQDNQTVFNFREMTAEEIATYETLCPVHAKVKEFGNEMIPLRVLEVLKKAQDTGYLTTIEVWHKQGLREDPVLVGRWEEKYNVKWYLLARWGEVLEPLEKLVVKAKEKLMQELRNEIKSYSAEIKAYEEKIEHLVNLFFNGQGSKPNPYWHG